LITNTSDRVAVAILNWNGIDWLKKFLPTVVEYSKNEAIVYVIDNASNDGSRVYITNNFSDVRIIQLTDNFGFAEGYNQGIKQIEKEYIVLLNSDVEVTPNWITPIIQLMDKDKTVGACQPKIKAYDNKSYFEYAGAAGGYIDKNGYPFCRGRIFNTLEKDESQYNDAAEIFWATGACMFVRREAFVKAGMLDANFFAHMEEIDLCWRMKNQSNKIMYCSDSTVYHVGGGTLQKSNPHKTFLNFRNSLLMLYKNLPNNKVFQVIATRLMLDAVAGIKFLLQGKLLDTVAVIKAHFSFYTLVNKYNKSGIYQYPSKVYHRNIVLDYYLSGKKKFTDLAFGN
jgi:GT2 family glycosyltransferase